MGAIPPFHLTTILLKMQGDVFPAERGRTPGAALAGKGFPSYRCLGVLTKVSAAGEVTKGERPGSHFVVPVASPL